MSDKELTKSELLAELTTLRQKVAALENSASNQKIAKESLRDMENILSLFMEFSPIHVFLKDEKTRSVRLSKNYEQMLGKPIAELLNKTVYELFPSDFAKRMVADDLRILREGKVFKIEEEFNGKIYSTIKFPIIMESKKKFLAGFTMDITEHKTTENERQMVVRQLRKTLGAIIQAMVVTIEARDPYTAGHQHRVADLARSIAKEMSIPNDRVDGIRMASVIHDIGKISIPSEILSKPTVLTDIEYEMIKSHPQTGYDILRDIEFSSPIARIVLEHHERMDGSGYPNGLTRNDLLMESRILMIADIVEAMASHRPYRPGLGIEVALHEITKGRGILYEPDAVDACIKLFSDKGYKFKVNGSRSSILSTDNTARTVIL